MYTHLCYTGTVTQEDLLKRYLESSKRNLDTARDLRTNSHFDWALFLGQLALEKLLKALVLKKTESLPPNIHDLTKLVELAGLEIDEMKKDWLVEITRYHIQARYDDIKYELYKTATVHYADLWFGRIEELFLWINTHF